MSTPAGYQSPSVAVATTLPKRGAGATVLIVGVVGSDPDDTGGTPTVVANPFLDAEATGEIEVALAALGAKGGADEVTRVLAPSLPVASVLAVGLGKPRDEWPADVIRRAAGVAARALGLRMKVVAYDPFLTAERAVEMGVEKADLDTLLQKIVDEAFLLIRADRAVILLLDAETEDFVPRYVRQKRDEEIKLSKSILDEVRRLGSEMPAMTSRISVSVPLIPPLRDLKPEELDVLQLAHNYGHVETVMNKCLAGDLETSQILVKLIKGNYVRVD